MMVTENGDHAVRMVIRIEFLLNCPRLRRALIELLLEGDRGIIGTEHLRGETLHVGLQVLVELRRLGRLISIYETD